MFNPAVVIGVFCLYMGLLFLVALWVERRSVSGRSPANNAVVYSLSLAVYCTAWTYYGSVGKAATSGMLFLTIYLGPTACIFLWWILLRKMVRLKTTHRITSIADFISTRYNKSQPLAALVTVIALVGLVPYIALQLKAVISTFDIITGSLGEDMAAGSAPASWFGGHVGPVVVFLMIIFTIMFGVRRLDPTERHEGMMMALAVECLVKLVAFLAAGVFVTYFLYDGFADIFNRFMESPFRDQIGFGGRSPEPYLSRTWTSYMILSTSAILFLPRQFHVSVVENSSEKHIRTAMWAFPLYMLLINIFVVPIALGGLLKGYPVYRADTFVLNLPLQHGNQWLTLLVFLGGFSAAAGMIMISAMTMSIMATNHLLLPLVGWFRRLDFLKHHLLRCRWAAVTGFILVGYWFEERIGESYMLVNIGLISFAAVLQFAPPILGGLFWRRANKAGAMMGLAAGFVIWLYTLLLPSFIKSGWAANGLLELGPWGIELLNPEQLFGLSGLDPLSHTVFWSLLFNIGLYVLGSLYFESSREERSLAGEFVDAMKTSPALRFGEQREAYIDVEVKKREIESLLRQYFSEPEVKRMLERCLAAVGIKDKKRISIVQLVELHGEVEKALGGAIGSAAAHKALRKGTIFSPREAKELSEVYGEILSELKVTPTELKEKIDYYQEKEMLLTRQAMELEERIREREREITQRRRAQEALRESEERYRRLVESMNEGLLIEDERGVITYVNDSFCRMLGCRPEEAVGNSVASFLDEEQREILETETTKRRSGEIGSYEMTWTATDGSRIATIVSAVPITDSLNRYTGSFAVITDITQRKRTEEALRESEERYRSLVENVDLGIALIDTDYNIVMTNAALRRLFGKNMIQFVGCKCYRELVGRESMCPYCPGQKAMASGQSEEMEREGVRSDGSRFPARVQVFPVSKSDGNISGFIEVIEDITERRRAEEERRRLATAVEQAAESILITEKDGTIEYVNPAFETISGYSREEVIGRSSRMLQSGQHGKEFYENIRETLRRGEVWTGHIIDQKKDGELYEVETTISPIRDESGNIINFVSVGRDVTQMVRLEKQLRQAQKMEAIGTLAGGIAHDFNNILTIIIGFSEMALEDLPQDEDMRADLEEVLKAAYRARGLVEQILTFSRQTEQERKPLEVGPIVKEAVKLLRSSIPVTVEIRQNIDTDSGMVLADPTQIHQVIMNLCTNAAHAMREKGGVLEVDINEVEIDAEAAPQYPDLEPGTYIRLTVSDTGHGMDRSVMERIFDPFFTTKGPTEGTGLGLAVVYGIVKSHGGTVTVYSEPGKGTTFHVLLPKVEGEVESEIETVEPVPQGHESILFVDDEEAVLQMGRRMLERLGYSVQPCDNAEDALEIFRKDPQRFDLAITDQTMPDMTGAELVQEMLAIRPDLPIILCTGFSNVIGREKAEALGIREFVMKPIVKREFAKTIRKVLDEEPAAGGAGERGEEEVEKVGRDEGERVGK